MSIFDKESNFSSGNFRSRNYSGKWQRKFVDEYVDLIYKKGIDEAHKEFSEAKNEHLPNSLYKFYSPSIYSLISIQNSNIALSSPRNFNDPFDSYICVDSEQYLKRYILNAFEQNKMMSKESTPDKFSDEEFYTLKDAPVVGSYKSDGFWGRLNYFRFIKPAIISRHHDPEKDRIGYGRN